MGKGERFISNHDKLMINLEWGSHHRIIPSKFPPVDFFEDLVDPELMEEVFYLESLTNDRLREQVGDIHLVAKEDRISGKGSSWVMAAFTHPATDASRFSNGDYGIYYAAKELETAIRETVYHTEIFLGYTNEPQGRHIRRVLKGKKILNPLIDIRNEKYNDLHHPDNLVSAREFGIKVKRENDWGILYRSVRHQGGECIAVFRPIAIELPVIQSKHLEYCWDGKKITDVIELKSLLHAL